MTTWGATTSQILALREHLIAEKVTCVVIESTSDYWKPFYYLLDDALDMMLVNASRVRNVPGRKTDVSDAVAGRSRGARPGDGVVGAAATDPGAAGSVSVSAYEVATESWWDILYPANALANGQWWLMANQCGGEGPNALLGRSRIIAPDGAAIAEAPRWDGHGHETYLLVLSLDLSTAVAAAEQDAGALWASGHR